MRIGYYEITYDKTPFGFDNSKTKSAGYLSLYIIIIVLG